MPAEYSQFTDDGEAIKPLSNINAQTAVGAGATLLGGKLFNDVNLADAANRGWEARTLRAGRVFNQLAGNHSLDDVQRVVDAYVQGGQNAAQRSLVGIPAAVFPKTYARYIDKLERYHVPKAHREIAAPIFAQRLKNKLHHYDLFSNRSLQPEELRGHMVEKAVESFEPGLSNRLHPEIKKILYDGSHSLQQRYDALGQLATKPELSELAAKAQKLLHESHLGAPGRSGPVGMGEVARLVGSNHSVSTPRVYAESLQGVLGGLRTGSKLLGGLGAGLIGTSVLSNYFQRAPLAMNQTKVASAQEQQAGQPSFVHNPINQATALLGTSPLFLHSGYKTLTDPALKNIGVTYGQQKYNGAMIGAGHREPGEALFAMLDAENRAKGYGFNLSRVVRNEHGILGKLDRVEQGGKLLDKFSPGALRRDGAQAFNTLVNTGFGARVPLMDFAAEGVGQRVLNNGKIKTRSLVNYLTDAVPDDWKAFGATGADTNFKGRSLMVGWGDSFLKNKAGLNSLPRRAAASNFLSRTLGRLGHPLGVGLGYHEPVHMGSSMPFAVDPATLKLTDEVRSVDDARNALHSFVNDPSSDQGLRTKIKGVLDDHAAGKKLVTFSGASRGDYVTSRAAELRELLKSQGRDDVSVIAQLGDAFNDPKQMKMLDGVRGAGLHEFGRLPRKQFIALQNLANLHHNNTGTSSWVEALLGRGNNVQPRDWGMYETYPDRKKLFADEMLGGGKPDSIARRFQQRLLATLPESERAANQYHGQFGIAGWNRGHLQDQARRGFMQADTAQELLAHLDSGRQNAQIAGTIKSEIGAAQRNFVRTIFNEAKANKLRAMLSGGGQVGLGLLAPLAAAQILRKDKGLSFNQPAQG